MSSAPVKSATEASPPARPYKKVQLCPGNDRSTADSGNEPQRPSNPLATKQLCAAISLLWKPLKELEEELAEGRAFIHPFTIKDMLVKLKGDDVLSVSGWAREAAERIKANDPAKAAEGLCQFTCELVEKLNQLHAALALGDAPTRIPKWPTNIPSHDVGTDAKTIALIESRAGTLQNSSVHTDANWRTWTQAACEAVRLETRQSAG